MSTSNKGRGFQAFCIKLVPLDPLTKNFGVIRVNKTAAEPSKSKYKKKEKTWDLLRVLLKLSTLCVSE